MASNPNDQAPSSQRLVRIRIYLVSNDREVFPARIYLRSLNLTTDTMQGVEAYLNQLLEQVAVEHREERPPGDYRIEVTDNITDELLMDWRYVPPAAAWWRS